MTGENEQLKKRNVRSAKTTRDDASQTEATCTPEANDEAGESARIGNGGSNPPDETQNTLSEADIQEVSRIYDVIRESLDLMLRRYRRKVDEGKREAAEAELDQLLARARRFLTCVPAPEDTVPGPWTALSENLGQEDECSYWGRPLYWLERRVGHLSVVVMGTQSWAEDPSQVAPSVLVVDSAHPPYTEAWRRVITSEPEDAREIAAALAEAAEKADAVAATPCQDND